MLNNYEIKAVETVIAWGHHNVRATHRTTLEITVEDFLTVRGDCILGIKSDKALVHFNDKFKKELRSRDSRLLTIFYSNGNYDYLLAKGSPELTFESDKKIIFRKSEYINDATVAIKANKAAADINRRLVQELVKGKKLIITMIVLK